MGLNHISLPEFVIADLYRNALIDTGKAEDAYSPAPPTVSKPTFDPKKYLGENQKNILIIVEYPYAVHLPDDELDFLTNMLTACKLSLADVAIVNSNTVNGITYKEAISGYKSKIVFLFALDPVSFGLPIDFPHFQVQAYSNTTFLFAPSLGECRNDQVLKSKLWVCLRRIFGI